ncbi:P-loop containing nucleoside triphosphate hydrolase protein [Aspergillus pseudonomiae]|nr:P-loop containing nucleoside triphosphate hydrolase protein [Aspergillus pseudonomiae]
MSQPLFRKGSSTVKFPVKSIKYHGSNEDTTMAKEIATDPAISLMLSSAFIKLRQGTSIDQGRSRSFWNITFHVNEVTIVSLETKENELVYTFKSNLGLVGEADTEKAGNLPQASTYPLAAAPLLNKVVVIALGLPSAKLWAKQSELVCQALRGDRFTLSQAETAYITLNRDAINTEAEEEHKCLGEERPFRLYRGCTLVLRGEEWFNQEKAKDYHIPGEKGVPEDWVASVTETSPKWTGLIDAPVHAVLLNQVDIKFIGQVEEDDVKVHQVANPIVQMQMLSATRKLSEHWGEESFDAMCREFENQEATIPSESNKRLPLKSMFLASTPRINTHDPWDTSLTDLNSLVPESWGLNEAETEAATQLLTHSFSLVVGPPGTGKTSTIAAAAMLVTQILARGSVGHAKLAVLVPTHAAGAAVMNQLCTAFDHEKYRMDMLVRLRGRADSEARLFAAVTEPSDDVERMIACAKKAPGKYREFLAGIQDIKASGRVKRKFKEFNHQRQELIRNIMKDVQIVVTLPLNVREMVRREFNPEFVIFDEASFFRDPEIFYILGQLKIDARVLFVGDHRQLSPPVFTRQGEMAWAISAFERLINKKYDQTLLNVSYRSHTILYQPTSVAYYDGQVQALYAAPRVNVGINPQNPLVARQGNRTWTLPGLSHFLHLAHVEGDTNKDPSGSLFHPMEAEVGIALARSLVDRGCQEILIMSPYRAQVALVKKLWEQRHPDAAPCPRVQTVDASQGSEAQVVIVLITRNSGSAGFLQSVKRTNVMLSRARTVQYVVGNWDWVGGRSFTMDAGKFYRYLDEAGRSLGKRAKYFTVSPKVGQ